MLYYQRYSIQIDTITTRKYPNVSLEYLKFTDLSIESKCTDTKCDVGTFGPKCEHVCPYPHYGKLCLSECNCSKDHCNPVNGCYGTIFS